MKSLYHRGELEMQKKAGSSNLAAGLARTVLPGIAHKFIAFIEAQPLLLVAAADPQRKTWASVICGKPGFIQVSDEQTLRIDELPGEEDPLSNVLTEERDVGLLLIEFASARRLRINGKARRHERALQVKTRQVYANCPRYIQAREWELLEKSRQAPEAEWKSGLNPELRQWIEGADTFFIASHHPESGADLSHRGGFPGFVQVIDERSLVWPEYNGNGMFNTLGNIVENPRVGLLFIDFDSGRTLQLTGTATIVWEEERVAAIPGAERLVAFKLDQALVSSHAGRLRWRFMNYSPDNPWFC